MCRALIITYMYKSQLNIRKEKYQEDACAQLETTAMTFPLACMMGLYVQPFFFLLPHHLHLKLLPLIRCLKMRWRHVSLDVRLGCFW